MNSAENLIQFIDYTTLSEQDTQRSVTAFVDRAISLYSKGLPRVASICTYPSLIESVGLALGDSDIAITAVCGGFPTSQTYIEVKMLEVAMAIENGADEIDMVINIGAILSGEYELAKSEIEIIAAEIDGDALLKVIIESGVLGSDEMIYRASILAMEAGADFIKTSTGKAAVGVTPDAVRTICLAIKDYYAKTGKKVGIKVSGGISEVQQAMLYYDIVGQELGTEWQRVELFRIGTSRLLDNIVK